MSKMMHAFTVTAALLAALLVATPGHAQTSCQTSCGGTTIKCCTQAGTTCSATTGVSVSCSSGSILCSAVSANQTCRNNCLTRRTSCIQACGGIRGDCSADCYDNYFFCNVGCGTVPTTIGC